MFNEDIFISSSGSVNVTTAPGETITVIPEAEAATHAGNYYSVSTVGQVNNVTDFYLVVNTAVDKTLHASFSISAAATITVETIEDVIVTGGSSVLAYNNNRTSGNTASATFLETPTTVTGGLVFFKTIIPGGSQGSGNQNGSLGATPTGAGEEFIFAPSKVYAIKITHSDNTLEDVSINLGFYENGV
jgi:hypothetical protein